ncbi:hypothetical protein [Halomonas sp. E14]|uniref:hypothetical protein n=1 Tax=Halomonas sp. E14 TaxID=3397245 RepID=UPI00403EA712
MLNNVPSGINAMARNVIIRHPNAYNCEVYRRQIGRPDPEAGGAPTLGGMMVLNPEDEDDIRWEMVGLGFALPAEQFQPSQMMDRRDANNGYADELRFLVEPEEMIGEPGGFEVKNRDVIYLLLGEGEQAPKIAYEIVAVEAVVNVPPFVPRYVVNRRDDLDIIDPDEPEDDEIA